MTQIDPMHMRQDTGLSYFCGASFEYQDTPAEMDDFQLLPDDRGWQDTIHFKDEGHRCSMGPLLYLFPERYTQRFP